eukprot:TRINITY_DN33053_c0_g1_i9.p1 TRINITY_DN33053_c0_g1~~TRINITY_DN33053_c0_g1_i9.p1  ORF type:complete len:362 (-),score=17.43 TRINITY_DN33053_c0_g1_i9:177-1262(-)
MDFLGHISARPQGRSCCLLRRYVFLLVANAVVASAHRLRTLELPDVVGLEYDACIRRAQTEILRAPDKNELFVTTSHHFKRDLAEFFCRLPQPSQKSAMELGIFRGHTTSVLASIFGRVIAMDVEAQYLREAGDHCHKGGLYNIVFLHVDSYADDWRVFSANHVDVALIDGDHRYERVLSDAQRALSVLSPLEYVVFDDYGVEAGVRQVVADLISAEVLESCRFMGQGANGEQWLLKNWDWVNHSEGVLCTRGHGRIDSVRAAAFQDKAYLLHPKDMDYLNRASSVISFQSSGGVWTSNFGHGEWQWPVQAGPRAGSAPYSSETARALRDLDAFFKRAVPPPKRPAWFSRPQVRQSALKGP